MSRRRKNGASSLIMIVLGIILLIVSLIIGAFGVMNFKESNDLDKKITALIQMKNEKSEIVEAKKNELKEVKVEAERLEAEKKRLEELEKQEELERQTAIYDIPSGTILDEKKIEDHEELYFQSFEIKEGDPVYERIIGKSYVPNDNIDISDLRYLKILHCNFDHVSQMGEMIVNVQISEEILEIFRYLYQNEYEIESMHLIDDYWQGDGESSDTASIEVNNTSAFCYRLVTGGSTWSRHAFGYAIDLNPQQNPYVTYDWNGTPSCYHVNAREYIDRSSGDPHVIVRGDICYNIFTQYGYTWGGNWDNPIDYQHFQKE